MGALGFDYFEKFTETFLVIFKLGFRSNYEVKVNRFVDHQKEGGMGKLKTLVVSNLNSPI